MPPVILTKPFFFNRVVKVVYLGFIGVYFFFNSLVPCIYNISMKEHIFENVGRVPDL